MKVKNKQMYKIILYFLKKNHCLSQFIFNCKKQQHVNINNINDFKIYIDSFKYPDVLINESFTWDLTKEGYTYWSGKNRLLEKFLNYWYYNYEKYY